MALAAGTPFAEGRKRRAKSQRLRTSTSTGHAMRGEKKRKRDEVGEQVDMYNDGTLPYADLPVQYGGNVAYLVLGTGSV